MRARPLVRECCLRSSPTAASRVTQFSTTVLDVRVLAVWVMPLWLCVCRRYQVLKVFRRFGNVTKVEFMWHRDGPRRGQPRGYCFVEYEKHEVRVSHEAVWVAAFVR